MSTTQIATSTTLLAGAAVLAYLGFQFFQKKKNVTIPTNWDEVGSLQQLLIYPLKSGHRMELNKANCTDVGLKQTKEDEELLQLRDRGFVVYGERDNEFRTARTYPKLMQIDLSVHDEKHLAVDAPTMRTLYVKIPNSSENKTLKITLHGGEECNTIDCGDEAALWFSRYILEKDNGLRLGYHDASQRRDITKTHTKYFNFYKNLSNLSVVREFIFSNTYGRSGIVAYYQIIAVVNAAYFRTLLFHIEVLPPHRSIGRALSAFWVLTSSQPCKLCYKQCRVHDALVNLGHIPFHQIVFSFVLKFNANCQFSTVNVFPGISFRSALKKANRVFNLKIFVGLYSDLTSLLLVNQKSVDDIKEKINSVTISSNYFRPNLVVNGPDLKPYTEDDWEWIKIGDAIMRNVKDCTRCMMTTIDPDTSVRNQYREPLVTLGKHRISNGPEALPIMGIHLEVRKPGIIKVGDKVLVSRKE